MALLSQQVRNLFSGVSQQPQSQRSPSQLNEQVNMLVYQGRQVGRRPGSVHVSRLTTETTGDPFVFSIVRSASEKYTAVIVNGTISVYDAFTGDAITVEETEGFSYLTGATDGFRALTLGDRTVVLNRSMVTAKGTTVSTAGGEVTLLVVRQGNFGTTYSVTIDGTTVSHLTPKSSVATAEDDIATDVIATELFDLLDAEAAFNAGFSFSRLGSTIAITPLTAGGSYSVTTSDGLGDEGLFVCKGSVQRFEDLPLQAPSGTLLEVRGDASSAFDNFWVTYSSATGVWRETVAPSCLLDFDVTTMPHVLEYQGRYLDKTVHTGVSSGTVFSNTDLSLVPNALAGKRLVNLTDGSTGTVLSNGVSTITVNALTGGGRNTFLGRDEIEVTGYGEYFLFRPAPWSQRTVGDTLTNPYPSFIGKPLKALFVTQGRLGLIAGSSIVTSRTAEPFDLFRATVTQVLPDQPLDLTETLPASSQFHSFVEWDGKPIIFTDLAQYWLRGDPVLTPETVSLVRIGQYQNLATCPPTAAGSRVFFVGITNGLTRVMEFSVFGQEQRIAAQSLTEEVPTYIDGSPVLLAADDTYGLLLVFTVDAGDTRLYAMSYSVDNAQIVLKSWGRWDLGTIQPEPNFSAISTADATLTDPFYILLSEDSDELLTEDGDTLLMDL